MRVNPYLNFPGTGVQAMTFYAEVFGGEPTIMRFKDVPMPDLSTEAAELLLHGSLELGNITLMASDLTPEMEYVPGRNVSLNVNLDDHAEQDRVFAALAEGGVVGVAPEEAFFGRWGHLTDRFGIQWMLVVQPTQD